MNKFHLSSFLSQKYRNFVTKYKIEFDKITAIIYKWEQINKTLFKGVEFDTFNATGVISRLIGRDLCSQRDLYKNVFRFGNAKKNGVTEPE